MNGNAWTAHWRITPQVMYEPVTRAYDWKKAPAASICRFSNSQRVGVLPLAVGWSGIHRMSRDWGYLGFVVLLAGLLLRYCITVVLMGLSV